MLLDRCEQIGRSGVIADAGAERIGLLRTRFGQAVHRLDGAQEADMRHACGLGIIWLHMRPGKDRRDAILQIMPGLIMIRTDRRIGQSAIPAFIIVLVESDDEKAVVCLRPLVIAVEILLEPQISYRDAVLCVGDQRPRITYNDASVYWAAFQAQNRLPFSLGFFQRQTCRRVG